MNRHVCIVSNTLADGGAERWASSTCSVLAGARDLRVSLILFRALQTYPCPDSVTINVVDHRHFGHSIRTVGRLRRTLTENDVDVVISNSAFTGQFVGQAVRGTDARWIARISGNIARAQQSRLKRWGWRWLDRNISRATAIVANSERLTSEAKDRWPGLAERTICIPNGVDVQHLMATSTQPTGTPIAEPRPRPTIIAAGRLHPIKRPDIFLEAVSLLRENIDVKAHWCGDGPLREDTERRIAEMELDSHVSVIGFRQDLATWIGKADCFVMTSDHEGSPNVLAEAMAVGVPVVSTDCDHGPRELLADDRGWLVPVGDATGVAEAVAEILSNPEQSKRRARMAQSWVQQNLDLRSIGVRWQELIDQPGVCLDERVADPPGRTA